MCNVSLSSNETATEECNQSFYLPKSDEIIIRKLIDMLDKIKPPGTDNTRISDLKLIKKSISPIISNLMNLSIDTSHVPTKLKEAFIRSIHKGDFQ